MSDKHTRYHNETDRLMKEKGIPFHGANDVMWLREQKHWSGALEDALIAAWQRGESPNVMTFTL